MSVRHFILVVGLSTFIGCQQQSSITSTESKSESIADANSLARNSSVENKAEGRHLSAVVLNDDTDQPLAKDKLRVAVGKARPLRLLPGHLTARQGQLSLIADFRDRRDDSVVLYLINRSGKEMKFPGQDGDIYVKLETRVEKKWQRAQGHIDSLCGESYYDVSLASGHFFQFLGHSPAKGRKASVRYTLFNEPRISSNVGVGFVDPQTVLRCRYDSWAIADGDFEFVAPFAEGKKQFIRRPEDWDLDTRHRAIFRLGALAKQGDRQAMSLLKKLAIDPKTPMRYFESAYHAMQTFLPSHALNFYLDVIRDKQHSRRFNLIFQWHAKTPKILQELKKLIEDSSDPHFIHVVRNYAGYRIPAVRTKLKSLIANEGLPQKTRARIKEIYHSYFPNDRFKLRILKRNTVNRQRGESLEFTLELENLSDKPITLRNRPLAEIITLVVKKDTPKRPEVRQVDGKPGISGRTTVTVPPGGKTSWRLDLNKQYDLPPGNYIFRCKCLLPEICDVPAITGGLTASILK